MPIEIETCRIESLFDAPEKRSALIATPSVSSFVAELSLTRHADFSTLSKTIERLVVIGGGHLIDEAKLWKWENAPQIELIAVPSIWGSGAEVSPVAVRNTATGKEIHVDPDLVPDRACFWPDLASGIPDNLARYACGDAWSHALEAFLSPLAGDELKTELAGVIRRMLDLPITNDPRWFEVSAIACAGQAQSSVGLVHGIAHTLEGPLRLGFPDSGWGHAKLCSVFLWPVMEFNRQCSEKWSSLCTQYQLDDAAILTKLRELHDHAAYNQALPLLESNWMNILKDPCSRTNSCLVRPASKAFFLKQFDS